MPVHRAASHKCIYTLQPSPDERGGHKTVADDIADRETNQRF